VTSFHIFHSIRKELYLYIY